MSKLRVFDEVKIKPELYAGDDDVTIHNYIVIKSYTVELGDQEVPFVDIVRQSGGNMPVELKKNNMESIITMPRWTKPFILSFPEKDIALLE